MRERLVAAFLLVAVSVLVVFAVVRAVAVHGLVEHQRDQQLRHSAALIAAVVAAHRSDGANVAATDLRPLLADREQVEYDGPGGPLRASRPGFVAAGALRQTVAVPTGGRVVLREARSVVTDTTAGVLVPLYTVGLVLVGFAVLLGWLAARRLSRPFEELAGIARDLGRGRLDVRVRRYRVREADLVGRALEAGASRLHMLVVREHEFAGQVSHLLRTPITALRLELEDLALWQQTPPAVADQLGRAMRELDRLAGTVSNLLDAARLQRLGPGASAGIDVGELARESASRWVAVAQADERALSVHADAVPRLHLAPGPVEQVLDVLLKNALDHGRGEVLLEVHEFEEHVRLRVRGQGCAQLTEEVFRRGPRSAVGTTDVQPRLVGLAAASQIAEALGGYLAVDRGPVTSFSLMLPRT